MYQPVRENTSLLHHANFRQTPLYHSYYRDPSVQNTEPSYSSYIFSSVSKCVKKVVDFCIEPAADDDVVTTGVKDFCVALSACMLCWLVSFVLVMLEVIESGQFVRNKAILFVPMWVGSAIGILSVVAISLRICYNATLVPRERRLFMRAQGMDSSHQFIDYDSLPLMRRLLWWNIVLGVSFLFALVAQTLFYLWFVHEIMGLWEALLPVAIIGVVYLTYLYIIEAFSTTASIVISLLALQMIIFVLKKNEEMFQTVTWSTATVPVMAAQVYGFRYAVLVYWKYFSGYFLLTKVQVGCLLAYTAALLMATAAQAMRIAMDYIIIIDAPAVEDVFNSRIAILYTIAISLGMFCGAMVLVLHGKEIASTRGFSDPLPLSRTKEGWTVSRFGRTQHSILLGNIRIAQSQIASVLIKSRDVLVNNTISASIDSTCDQPRTKIEAKPIGSVLYHHDVHNHHERNRRNATGTDS